MKVGYEVIPQRYIDKVLLSLYMFWQSGLLNNIHRTFPKQNTPPGCFYIHFFILNFVFVKYLDK